MTEITDSLNKSTIGKFAYEWLVQSNQAVVWGNTSSGLFLRILGNKIIFLTKNYDFGPVNVIFQNQIPVQWKNEDDVQIIHADQEFTLSNHNQQIDIIIENIWNTPLNPSGSIPENEQKSRLKQAANQLSMLKNSQGYAPILLPFLRNEVPNEFENQWLKKSWDNIIQLKVGLLEKDKSKVFSLSRRLIGSGRGLTPSGDDLLTGLVFMKKRWFEKHEWMLEMEENLLHEFQQNTTAVSSTLFFCALQGEADARIQEMSDALMSAEIPFQQQAIELSRWGNSSGADVFLGMILAIVCFQNNI